MTKEEAKGLGLKRYDGKCHYHGFVQRYVNNKACVECQKRHGQGMTQQRRANFKELSGYEGPPCRKCQSTWRYVSNSSCMNCQKVKGREGLYRRKYGLSLDDLERLRQGQEARCMICKRPETTLSSILVVDHCHQTNKVRSLLCHRCNRVLGEVREDISLLEAMVAYIQRHQL